jgi:hypothetical protein
MCISPAAPLGPRHSTSDNGTPVKPKGTRTWTDCTSTSHIAHPQGGHTRLSHRVSVTWSHHRLAWQRSRASRGCKLAVVLQAYCACWQTAAASTSASVCVLIVKFVGPFPWTTAALMMCHGEPVNKVRVWLPAAASTCMPAYKRGIEAATRCVRFTGGWNEATQATGRQLR